MGRAAGEPPARDAGSEAFAKPPAHPVAHLRQPVFRCDQDLEDVLPDVEATRHAVVAIVLRGHDEIGSTFLTVLKHYAKVLQDHDSKLLLVGVNPAVLDQLAKTRVLTLIGEENVFQATSQTGAALNQAVAAANAWLGQRTPRSGLKPL